MEQNEYREPIVKYASELNALDLGGTVSWIHKYKYKGEQREKLKSVSNLHEITHMRSGVKLYIKYSYKNYWGKTQWSYKDGGTLKLNTKVAVTWED